MNERQKEVLNYIQKNQPIKSGDITKDLPQYSAAIIKKDLQYLVNEFEIEKLGNNRGTIYKIKANFIFYTNFKENGAKNYRNQSKCG